MYIEPKEWKPNTTYIKNDIVSYNHQIFIVDRDFTSSDKFDMSYLSLWEEDYSLNIDAINNISTTPYLLNTSTLIRDAAHMVLLNLRGVQYIKAKAILEEALALLSTRAKID